MADNATTATNTSEPVETVVEMAQVTPAVDISAAQSESEHPGPASPSPSRPESPESAPESADTAAANGLANAEAIEEEEKTREVVLENLEQEVPAGIALTAAEIGVGGVSLLHIGGPRLPFRKV